MWWCIPFKSTQNSCNQILYIEIGKDYFYVYDLNNVDVTAINVKVSASNTPKILFLQITKAMQKNFFNIGFIFKC